MTLSLHGGRIGWADAVVLSLAGAIVYPDHVLEWWSDQTGKTFGWLHLIVLELVAIGLLALAMYLLMPICPRLVWWEPVLMVGLLAAIRFGVWLVLQVFGLDD
jgi:hypothetical protein